MVKKDYYILRPPNSDVLPDDTSTTEGVDNERCFGLWVDVFLSIDTLLVEVIQADGNVFNNLCILGRRG